MPRFPSARRKARCSPGSRRSTAGRVSGYGEISSVDRNPADRRGRRARRPIRRARAIPGAWSATRKPSSTGRDDDKPEADARARHASDGGGPAGPQADLGGGALVSAATARTSTTATGAACPRTATSSARRPGRIPYLGIINDENHEFAPGDVDRNPPGRGGARRLRARGQGPRRSEEVRSGRPCAAQRRHLHGGRRAQLGRNGRDRRRPHRLHRQRRGREGLHRSRRPRSSNSRAAWWSRACRTCTSTRSRAASRRTAAT